MFDYEKLKLAHELSYKYTKDTGMRCDFYVSHYDHGQIVYGFSDYSRSKYPYESVYIDDLIAKLQELTQPKPKFHAGDIIFYANGKQEIEEKIVEIPGVDLLKATDGWTIIADACYPTREALIDAQLEYWQKLRNECMTPKFEGAIVGFNHSADKLEKVQCEHQDDGKVYTSYPPMVKCYKCGEFYR